MLGILRASLRSGRVTSSYPDVPEPAVGYRGRPNIEPERCDCAGACVAACPSRALTLTVGARASRRWQLDLARCIFCGLCVEACPNRAIAMTEDFELAARRRDDLIVGVTHGGTSNGTNGHASRTVPDGKAALAVSNDQQDALRERIGGLLRRSLHIRHMDAGSDNSADWEIAALLNPVYDVQRLGIDFVASPRHADLLLVTGAVTRHLEPALWATYSAMPAPRLVVAVGDEACGGGMWQGSYAVKGGLDRCLPVDVYIPGDPPRPQALIHGLLVALQRLEPKLRRVELTRGATPQS